MPDLEWNLTVWNRTARLERGRRRVEHCMGWGSLAVVRHHLSSRASTSAGQLYLGNSTRARALDPVPTKSLR